MRGRLRFLLASLVIFASLSAEGISAQRDPAESGSVANSSGRKTPIEFTRDVLPALTKAGCNMGACHGSFQGRGGFQLSLLGFDSRFDFDVLTKASRGRRLNAGIPERSLLLLKPTGLMPHGGGRRITPDSEVAQVIKDWISQGMAGPGPEDLRGLTLKVEPPELTIPAKQEGKEYRPVSLKVTATYADGTSHDVTRWAQYDIREKPTAEVDRMGFVTAHRPGKTAVQVKYSGQVAVVGVSIPYESTSTFEFPPQNYIDELAIVEWKRLGAKPAPLADDSTFIRRVYLDLIGTLPTPAEVRKFLADTSATKRSQLIDELLNRPEYVDYWSLRMADLLRAHRRYLGDKGLASFAGWIRQSVRENKPLDQLTRELLTAQGNLFTNGPVGYYFIDEKVEDLAETTSQVFLGVRLQCTRCHHHPNEVWSQDDYYGLASFFTRLETKDSGAAGARFGGPKSLRSTAKDNPNRKPLLTVKPRLFGDNVDIADPNIDPRQKLAEWITKPGNPFFARNFANRYWAALVGRGLVEPLDDMRATNPASFPSLLDALAKDFEAHHYDAKYLLRTICNSRVYQLASELNPQHDFDGLLFTHRIPKRLSAEVLLDGINQLTVSTEKFEGQPDGTRAISLPDPTVVSHFLSTFGRPMRNNPCDCARGSVLDLSQALHLANSTALHEKVSSSTGRLATSLKAGQTDDQIVEELYLASMSRLPTDAERQAVRELLTEGGSRDEIWQDVLWALINSSEFVFNH